VRHKFRLAELLVVILVIGGLLVWLVPRVESVRTAGSRVWALGELTQIAFSPDGKRLASVAHEGTIKLWDLETRAEVLTLKGHRDGASGVSFSHDGKRLASGGTDKLVGVWDTATGAKLLMLKGHDGPVTSVAFSADDRLLASGSSDQTVKI